jgi:hypothetical protein
MSIVVRYAPVPSSTVEQYDEVMRRLEESGEMPADGFDYHVAFISDGQLLVSEVWDSPEQLQAFGRVNRFPGKRVVTVAYFALVNQEDYHVVAGFTASDVRWRTLKEARGLIYDHDEILDFGVKYLKHKVQHEPIGFNLLPEKFTLLQLQELYETILSVKLDKPNFRRKMMKMDLLIPCNEKQQKVAHRAAALYRFDPKVYHKLTEQGFVFEI